MRFFSTLVFAALLSAGAPARAQAAASDSAAVVAVTQRLFDAMAVGDSTAFQDVLHPAAQVFFTGPGGDVRVRSAEEWAGAIVRSGGVGVERIWEPRVEADGDLAMLWTRYDFHVGDRFTHCGRDAFQFTRDSESAWRVLVVTFTREMEGCALQAHP